MEVGLSGLIADSESYFSLTTSWEKRQTAERFWNAAHSVLAWGRAVPHFSPIRCLILMNTL